MSQEIPDSLKQIQSAQYGDISVEGDGNKLELSLTQIIQISPENVKISPFNKNSPYKGLMSFDVGDRDIFFGRDQFIKSLEQELNQTNLILLLGASGSGKSSVVRAGLLPTLTKQHSQLFFLNLKPDRDPFESLYASLVGKYGQAEAEICREVKPDTLTRIVRKLKKTDEFWLLFIDQFEELFLINQSDKQECFVEGLVRLNDAIVKTKDKSVKIVMTMRADFFDRLSPYPKFVKATDKHRPFIAEMQTDELRLAIEQPAAKHGVVFETGLVEEITKEVQGQAGYLPLMQYMLNLLWETELQTGSIHDRTLNTSTYRNLGGVRGALQRHIDQIYSELSPLEQLASQQIFLKLVDINGDADLGNEWKPSRRRAFWSEFSGEIEQEVLVRLINQNLLVSNREPQSAEPTIEIAHEILFTSWAMLKSWVQDNRQAIALRNRLNEDVKQWQSTKANDDLWSGSRLEKVLELKDEKTFNQVLGGFSPDANQFIDSSLGKRNLAKRRALSIAFSVSGGTTMLALIAGIAFFRASYREATARSLQLATASSANLSIDTTRSLLLGIQASIVQDTPQANLAVWNAFNLNHERWLLFGHKSGINYTEFDPRNPRRILTVSSDHTARIWNLDNLSHPTSLQGHRDTIITGSFDPKNSNRVLTVSFDGTARIWDLNAPNNPIVLQGHNSPINYGMFDPKNSNRVLTVGSDGTARIWNINNPKLSIILRGHRGSIWSGSFDPKDSNRVLTVGKDSTARIWFLNQPEAPIILKGHSGDVLYGSFDPNNRNRILTVGIDRTLRLWNLSNPTQSLIFKGHEASITKASFDPFNKNRILTVSEDKTARIWNLDYPQSLPIVLRGHSGDVTYGIFNPKIPDQVLTTSADNTAKIWDLKEPETPKYVLFGHKDKVTTSTFSPNSPSQILTSSEDGTARLWDISNISNIQLESYNNGKKYGYISITFDPNSKNKMLAVDRDGRLIKWDISQPNNPEHLFELGLIENVFFSPSNPSIIATIGRDKRAYVWNINQSKEILYAFPGNEKINNASFDDKNPNRLLLISESLGIVWNLNKNTFTRLTVPSGVISNGKFNPDNDDQIALSDSNGFISIWSIKSGQSLSRFPASKETLWNINFVPNNSNYILSVGSDRIIRVWDIKNRKVVTELTGHRGRITYASFDPNNSKRIISIGYDGEAYIWDLGYPSTPLSINNFNHHIVSGSFDPFNSNRIAIVSDGGAVKIITIGGKDLLKLAWLQSSRCFTNQESISYKTNDLGPTNSLLDYFRKSFGLLMQEKYKSFCLPNSFKEEK
jgi:WD40 repeat protein/energy-coupling factor transporter ATP-binding protein EcfA2